MKMNLLRAAVPFLATTRGARTQEVENSRSLELQEANADGREQVLGPSPLLIAWEADGIAIHRPECGCPFCNSRAPDS